MVITKIWPGKKPQTCPRYWASLFSRTLNCSSLAICSNFTHCSYFYIFRKCISAAPQHCVCCRCTRRTARQSARPAAPTPHPEIGPQVRGGGVVQEGRESQSVREKGQAARKLRFDRSRAQPSCWVEVSDHINRVWVGKSTLLNVFVGQYECQDQPAGEKKTR